MIQLIENKGRRYTLPVTLTGGSNSQTSNLKLLPSSAFTAYFGVEGALGEADGDVVAESDLIRRAQNFSRGVVGDGVAALEELERAALFELKRGGFELAAAGDQRAVDLDAEVARALVERAAEFADASAKVERGESQASGCEAALLASGNTLKRGAQSFLLLMNATAQHGGARAQIE